ncbi:MAG: EscU/YscU/HrcU family type III secretion system export apparatus switch protein, partial [Steroidobacteraceae bacterium]
MAEKTHKPTAKKLRDARKRGEVVKSKELNSCALFAGLLAFLWFGGAFVTEQIIGVMEHALSAPASAGSLAWPWLDEMQSM